MEQGVKYLHHQNMDMKQDNIIKYLLLIISFFIMLTFILIFILFKKIAKING